MILVDTSVLIDYLRGADTPKTAAFTGVLEAGIPFGICGVVYQELLQGCGSDRDFRRLRTYLDTQSFYELLDGRESYIRAARLYFDLRRSGRTVRSTVDCLIAQIAIENGLRLLHDDADFDAIQAASKLRTYP